MFDKIGLGVIGSALILNIVGVAIPYWFYFSITVQSLTATIKFGLWQTCGDAPKPGAGGGDFSACESFGDESDLPSEFKAARALEILAIMTITAAAVVVCLKIFIKKDDKRLNDVAAVISVIAGLLMIIGAIVFVADNELKTIIESSFKGAGLDVTLKPHASFGLCIVSGILSFGASVLLCLAARNMTSY